MDRILQSDIDILVLRHLAAFSCTETARCLVKEKPELRAYIQMQGPMRNQRLLGGCTPATDSIQTLRSSTLIHSSLKDIICEYANAKAIVKELTDSIVFEWEALKYDEINSQDSIMTQLRAISKLVEKLCKAKPEVYNTATCTTEDGILPLPNEASNKTFVNAEVQTEIEQDGIKLMFCNNLLSKADFQEKLADSITQQLAAAADPHNSSDGEVVVKNVSSKTESEIDIFLREMLQEETEYGNTGSSSSLNSIEIKEQDYVDVEQNFISMFNDAQSIIESSQGTIQANVVQLRSAQKQQIDLVEMLTTPKKPPEVSLPSIVSHQNVRSHADTSVAIAEKFVAPCGKTYSVVTRPNMYPLNEWGRLGRRPIEPKTNASTNKRKAKFATPIKLTPVKAQTSSVNYHCPPEVKQQLNTPAPAAPDNKSNREESKSPEIEIVDHVVKQPVSTPNAQVVKPVLAKKSAPPPVPPSPKLAVMHPVTFSTPQAVKPVHNSTQPPSTKPVPIPNSNQLPSMKLEPVPIEPSSTAQLSTKKLLTLSEPIVTAIKTVPHRSVPFSGPLVRPVNLSGYSSFSPIKIVRNDGKSFPTQPMTFRPVVMSSNASQLPITIFSPPAAPTPKSQNSLNAVYSPITPVAADNETHSEPNLQIRMLSECKATPNQPQESISTPSRQTPAISKSSSTMSPFLRKLVTSAQKMKSTLAADIEKPNKKSYSTPRKKNHVRNLQFKTPPSLGKVNTENSETSSDPINPLKRKGDESILPKGKSKKRLEWLDTKIEDPIESPPTTTTTTPIVPEEPIPSTSGNLSSIERIAKRAAQYKRSQPDIATPVVKEQELKTPKLIIKNKNTVISVTPPESSATAAQQESSSEKVKPKHSNSKLKHLFSPPNTPPKKKRGRRSKNAIEAEAAQAVACDALPLGSRRGRTPRKKAKVPRSPLRTILPKPPPQTVESPTEAPILKLPATIPSSTPVVLVLPQAQVPPTPSSASVETLKPLPKTTIAISNSLATKPNISAQTTAPYNSTRSSLETVKIPIPKSAIATSSPLPTKPNILVQTTAPYNSTRSSLEAAKTHLPKNTSSSSLNVSVNTVKPGFMKNNSSSSLHTPFNTPLKTPLKISPEIPPTPTPRLFLTSNTEPDDLLKLNYDTSVNISKFFATPLKTGNPMTPGKIDNPILIDESSTGSIFDTPDKDPNAKPLDLTSPTYEVKPVVSNTTLNRPEIKESLQCPNKELKIGKPTIAQTGFKVSGRAKHLTMSEHETVIGLLHMREGIGSPCAKNANSKLTAPGTPRSKDYKLEQLIHNELNFDVNSFLQNFIHKK